MYIIVPYTKGLSECFKNVCDKREYKFILRWGKHYQEPPGVPKDKDSITNKSGVIYSSSVPKQVSNRSSLVSWKGPLVLDSRNISGTPPTYEHGNNPGHCINVDSFSIGGWVEHNITRTIKEVLFIRINDHPSAGT